MKRERYYYFCDLLSKSISGSENGMHLKTIEVFKQILDEMEQPYEFILPSQLYTSLCLNEESRSALANFKNAIKEAKRNSYLDFYPYFDWQSDNHERYIDTFITKYSKKPSKKWNLKESTIATMGSCFAGNILKPLKAEGAEVFTFSHGETNNTAPANEIILGIDYKINQQDQSLTLLPNSTEQKTFINYINAWNEENIKKGSKPNPNLFDAANFIQKLKTASHIIFTFGSAVGLFVEHEKRKHWIPYYFMRSEKSQWHELFSEEQIVNSMNNIIEKIKSLNPSIEVVITLSPIPLNGLITKENGTISPVELDCLSKSLQRICIDKLYKKRGDFYYFPSYEIIKWLAPTIAKQDHRWIDPRHPREETIKLATDSFIRQFFSR